MTLYEIGIIVAALVGFAVLRFGIPILVMWGLTRVVNVLAHPAS